MVKQVSKILYKGDQVLDVLDTVASPLLTCLSEQEKTILLEHCKFENYSAGSTIIKRDEVGTSVFFILSGSVHVLDYSASGRAISYTSFIEGDIFGEMAAIDCAPRSAWVLALTDCQVLRVSGQIFMQIAEKNHRFTLALLKKLSTNLRAMNERITEIFSLDAETRACIELMRMATQDPLKPDCYLVEKMPTQAKFATLIGASRETVSRIMSRLKNDAIIEISKQGLQILDKKKLEKRAFD